MKPLYLLACFALTCCQFASGLSDLHGESKPAQKTSSQSQGCSQDSDCDHSTPRCLSNTCVEESVAAQWICERGQAAKATSVKYAFHVVDFLTRMPPKEAVVKACRSYDVACESPVDTFTDEGRTGYAQFNLPRGFQGYFEIKSELLPTLLYVTKPIVENSENRDVPLVSPEALDLTAKLAELTMAPNTGLVLLDAVDCNNRPAAGIAFKSQDVDATLFCLVDKVPTKNTKLTVYDENDDTANCGFFNVPNAFVTFSAQLGKDGPQLQSFNAMVRANTVTFIDMMFY